MAMKQTQTKLFDFSDVGLDFCAGSKNLFPDRFKKMLALGYNEQTVSSVAVAGNQVTLSYGGTHGYVADRVLKVNAPELLSINGGEFFIDSVTENTVTMTIDGAPASIAGNFTTKVASLGWELVYEQAHIHIYKFKRIDDADMYARLCFQDATASGNRNCVAVGIGRTVDLALGHITDPNCMVDLATCATVAGATSNIRWDFTYSTARTFDGYTYSQGYSTFGQAKVVGSLYHCVLMTNVSGNSNGSPYTQGILPFFGGGYEQLSYPMLLASSNGASNTAAAADQHANMRFYVGMHRLGPEPKSLTLSTSIASNSFSEFDEFMTTTARPMTMYSGNGQVAGYVLGLYQVMYDSTNYPSTTLFDMPFKTVDIDFNASVYVQGVRTSSQSRAFLCTSVEEIKIA
ncbi:hypothetical protein [Acinetobacter towneri]|uniref:hypothetical protein n=1 Tax=Acinetobacter towneri TaxID=202956 RepID=UPI003A8A116D